VQILLDDLGAKDIDFACSVVVAHLYDTRYAGREEDGMQQCRDEAVKVSSSASLQALFFRQETITLV
jgi:hypothetical protein